MNHETAELVRAAMRGAVDVRSTPAGLTPVRLPLSAEPQFGTEWVGIASSQASGIHCAFSTAATWIELTVQTTGVALPQQADAASAVFATTVDGRPAAEVRASGGSLLHVDG